MRNDGGYGINGVYGEDGNNGEMVRDSVCGFFIFYSLFISVI
jgi:hypothetical protein